jgi:hypothetical protein
LTPSVVLRTPAEGADTIVWLAVSGPGGTHSGTFFFDREPRSTHLPLTGESEDERRDLWTRGKAVAQLGRSKSGGVVAWLLWVFVHVVFLVGFRNRFMVLVEWAFAYISFHRGARLITGGPATTKVTRERSRP